MIAFLDASLLRPLGLVAIAWLVLRAFRIQHPASRHAVWTAVLIGFLLLPIVSVFGPRWTLAVLPTADVDESRALVARTSEIPTPPVPVQSTTPIPSQSAPVNTSPAPFDWPSSEALITGGYIAGLFVIVLYRLMGWLLLQRVLSRSRHLRPACLRESPDVVTPVAVGVVRPSVILPTEWRSWSARTKRAVFAHESLTCGAATRWWHRSHDS